MNLFLVSIAYYLLKMFSWVMCALPLKAALFFGRLLGGIAYGISSKNRAQALSHIRQAFGGQLPARDQEKLARDFFRSYGMNLVEMARLPLLVRNGSADFVEVTGREHLDAAIKKGRGVIFLSIHSGNWELSNLVGSMSGHPYNMVANDMSRLTRIGAFLDGLRQSAGAKIIHPGIGGREIIRCLKKNEIVTLVADQGGREGILVPFFGRNCSMSTGAVRLAMKYDAQILLVNIHRIKGGRHHLEVEPFPVHVGKDTEKDVADQMARITARYEQWIRQYPCEYLWLYKTWKHSKDRTVLIIDDGRTGHLRQSEAVARELERALSGKAFQSRRVVLSLEYHSSFHSGALTALASVGFIPSAGRISWLRFFLKPECYERFLSFKPDYLIACGAKSAPVSCWLARENRSVNLQILRPGGMRFQDFSLVIVPRHDSRNPGKSVNTVITRAALNLVDKDYLADNTRGLVSRFSHLKTNLHPKLGLFIGGDAKGQLMNVQQIRLIVHQLKEILERYRMDILITTSRRTSAVVEDLLIKEFDRDKRCALLVVASRQNVAEAVGGILGLCDVVLVSGDSISMVSEAASSGKKVVVFPIDGANMKPLENKYTRFVDELSAEGFVAWAQTREVANVIDGVLRNKITTRPLTDKALITSALEKYIR